MQNSAEVLTRMRAIFMALPETTERPSHGAPSWFIRDKKSIATFWQHGHHEVDRTQMWCAAPTGSQTELIATDPAVFFRPPYVGHRGWIGVFLDGDIDWDEMAEVAEDAYRTVASAGLIAQLDARTNG